MRTESIRKIFAADIYAQWYIGPSRAEGLLQYALETLTAFTDPLYREKFDGTPNESWFWERIRTVENNLRSTIPTWMDEEENAPKNAEGIPLYRTGRGAKARHQEYIVSWIEAMLGQIKNETPQAAPGFGTLASLPEPLPAGPAPDWAAQWQWYEDTVNQAVRNAQNALPARDDIDWAEIWDMVADMHSPANLWGHYQFDPKGAVKVLENSVYQVILKKIELLEEEQEEIKGLLPQREGGRSSGGTAATYAE